MRCLGRPEPISARALVKRGAHFNQTKFDGCTLQGAEMGRSRVQSIVIGGRSEDDINRIYEWFSKESGITVSGGRCPTARQFIHLFGKYVTPLGSPKRDQLDNRALRAGRRFPGAASIEDCIRTAVSAGYLVERGHRGRYSRASGAEYAEIVEFVSQQRRVMGSGGCLRSCVRARAVCTNLDRHRYCPRFSVRWTWCHQTRSRPRLF